MSRWSDANKRYHDEQVAWSDAQPMIGRCLFCGWTMEGSTGEVRIAMMGHRLEEHPATKKYRRPRPTRQLSNFRPPVLNEEEQSEITAEIRRRAFLNGLEL